MPPDDQTVAKMESNKEEGQRAGFTVRQVVAKTRKVSGEIWDGREGEKEGQLSGPGDDL